MSTRMAARVAWTVVALGAVLGFTGTGLKIVVEGVLSWHFVANDALPIAIFFAWAVVGALVASRLPQNPIGWIFVSLSGFLGLAGGAGGYATHQIDHGQLGGLTPWAAWYSSYAFVCFFGAVVFVLLLFPDGRLLSPRWRVVGWAGGVGLSLFTLGAALQPGRLDDFAVVTNPAGIDSPIVNLMWLPGVLLLQAAVIGSATSIVIRFRRARSVERQQLTLLAVAGVVATSAICLSWASGSVFSSQDLGVAIVLLGVLVIPVAIGVAMLRYRLYDIGRLVNRTLVYASLTLLLAGAYVGLVLGGQAVFSSFAGGSQLSVAVSTLIVAALFLPVRSRVQGFVDRRFYRRRYDAQRTLELFGTRLREQVDLKTLQAELRDVVDQTMQPASVSLWSRSREASL